MCLLLPLLLAAASLASARPWSEEVMYFVMTDRFHDGDTENNIPNGCDPSLYDPQQKDINRFLGGDLRGLEKAIQSGYFNQLGITALWLTPVVKNVWRSGYDLGGWKTSYHGYWAQDWLDIDPHLTSKTDLTGNPYPDNPEGRTAHYRDFVRLAKSKGIRVIQDVVLNHAGPVFFYDIDGDGLLNRQTKDEWVQDFKPHGHHPNATWGNIPEWNLRQTQPDGPRTLLGVNIPTTGVLSRLDSYGRKGFSHDSLGKTDGEEVTCDFFSLRDFWTAPDSPHFHALIDEFVTIYHFYLTTIGVDGLRIDTVKHVHHEFWDAFTQRLREKLGPHAKDKLLFGEIYDGNPARLGQYTWRSDWPENESPGLDGVLDFHLCFTARDYLRHPGGTFGSPKSLEDSLRIRTATDDNGRPFYNPNPGPDGLNSQQKIITFIENHDGINRFRVAGITERRHRLAQALVMTLPGIPCLYYGAEAALLDQHGKIGHDGETGRKMFFHKNGPTRTDVRKSPAFRDIAALAKLRATHPVLRHGRIHPLWVDSEGSSEDDGLFAFARISADNKSFAIILINASDQPSTTRSGDYAITLPQGLATPTTTLTPILTIGPDSPPKTPPIPAQGKLHLPAPPQSLTIFHSNP